MHPWYHSDKPGFAPDCGMKLVPVYAPEAADQPKPGERKILYYQDAMNPSYHSDKPGLAPDGMQLVPVYASEPPAAALPPGGVKISPARQQLMGVTTAKAEYRALDQTIRSVGQVAMDETRLVHVHVRTSGWIKKVFVDYTWQQVKQGDPLFTFYSPDLLATEEEYLLALRARDSLAKSSFPEIATAGASLLEAARRRLELWDLTEGEIHDIEASGKPAHDITDITRQPPGMWWIARRSPINTSARKWISTNLWTSVRSGRRERFTNRTRPRSAWDSKPSSPRRRYQTSPCAEGSPSFPPPSSRTHEP